MLIEDRIYISNGVNNLRVYLKKHLLELGAITISLLSVFFAYDANQTSKEAYRASTLTFLSVSPDLIPINDKPLLDMSREFGIDTSVSRYVALFGKGKNLTAISWLTIRNVGSREARNAQLDVNIGLSRDKVPLDSIFWVSHSFELGDLAPGNGVTQDIFLTIPFSHMDTLSIAQLLQNYYEKGILHVYITAKASYLNEQSERIYSGNFSGRTENAGRRIGIFTNVKKIRLQ